jgi:hypothetical protein
MRELLARLAKEDLRRNPGRDGEKVALAIAAFLGATATQKIPANRKQARTQPDRLRQRQEAEGK